MERTEAPDDGQVECWQVEGWGRGKVTQGWRFLCSGVTSERRNTCVCVHERPRTTRERGRGGKSEKRRALC